MAEFTPKKVTANDFNNGIKYRDFDPITGYEGDTPRATDFNNVIENQLYVQGLVGDISNTVNAGDTNLVTGGAVYSAIDKVDTGKMLYSQQDSGTFTLEPDIYYSLDSISDMQIVFGESKAGRVNEYKGRLGFLPDGTVVFPNSVHWIGGFPTLDYAAIYEFSVIDNIGVIVRV